MHWHSSYCFTLTFIHYHSSNYFSMKQKSHKVILGQGGFCTISENIGCKNFTNLVLLLWPKHFGFFQNNTKHLNINKKKKLHIMAMSFFQSPTWGRYKLDLMSLWLCLKCWLWGKNLASCLNIFDIGLFGPKWPLSI